MGSVYGLLDGLARPNYLVCRLRRADPRRQYHPACHQHGQSHGGKQHYGASHKETCLPSGGGVRCLVRLDSRRPFISNMRSIIPCRGGCITQMSYLCMPDGYFWGRTSEKSTSTKFVHTEGQEQTTYREGEHGKRAR